VFTGVHPLVHQVTCHQNRAPYNLPQLSELFQDSGYYTATVGHYEHDRGLTRGWHEQVSFQESGVVATAMQRWYSHGSHENGWSSGTLEYPPEEGHAYRITTRAIDTLDGIVADGGPFFLHVPYLEPHPPYFASPPFDALVDPSTLPTPQQGDDRRPAWQDEARRQMGSAEGSADDVRRMVAVYYGMIAYVDGQMRRLHSALADRGLLDNTWIIIGADHGDYAGDKGLYTKTESLYECLLHVPLIIAPPEGVRWPGGTHVSGLVDQVDLFPTILGMAGTQTPEYAQGHDLVSWVRDVATEPLRDVAFAQVGDYHGSLGTTMPSGIAKAGRHLSLLQGARSGDFSYVRDPDYGDEAYDLRTDTRPSL
jgi:arylsulfatase A-like enzyme